MGVVLFYQFTIVPLGSNGWQFWSMLLFYGIVGPTVTYLTLNWIAAEVQLREEAQETLRQLYSELKDSHALLRALQSVTEQFATAPDLETVLIAASEGISQVTGASGAVVFLDSSGSRVTQSFGLNQVLLQDAMRRDQTLRHEGIVSEKIVLGDKIYWVLSTALNLANRPDGSIHAYYETAPSGEQRESFGILSSELSAVTEATRSRTRDFLTLIEVDRSIRAEGNLERLLKTLLTQLMGRIDAATGAVFLADEDGSLHLSSCLGASSSMAQVLRIEGGLVAEAAETLEPRVSHALSREEKYSCEALLHEANSAVFLPLKIDRELLGIVLLAHPGEGHFDAASLPFLDLVAGQVSLAVRNARAYLQSEELAIAEERARIAREIHDGVAQTLAFSALKLDLVGRLLNSDLQKAEAELGATKTTLRELIKEVRRSIFALRPVELERHGFVETIKRYCSDFGQQNNLQVQLSLNPLPELNPKSEVVLFRIFQEAMNNVAKHATAKQVEVVLGASGEGQVFISVMDDGIGFDISSISDRVTTAGGLGLKQMRERIEWRGGIFELRSQAGSGTKLYAAVPN